MEGALRVPRFIGSSLMLWLNDRVLTVDSHQESLFQFTWVIFFGNGAFELEFYYLQTEQGLVSLERPL